jgi:hypothetical protein
MDINQFQKDRTADLNKFHNEYSNLKRNYVQFLTQAVYETDPGKQADLVKQVLSTNSELAKHVREFIQSSGSKFNPAVISKLTSDIIHYQKEFKSIQEASNKTTALQNVLYKEKIELQKVHSEFNLWLVLLLSSIFIILVLVFKTSLTPLPQLVDPLESNTSMLDSVDSTGLVPD